MSLGDTVGPWNTRLPGHNAPAGAGACHVGERDTWGNGGSCMPCERVRTPSQISIEALFIPAPRCMRVMHAVLRSCSGKSLWWTTLLTLDDLVRWPEGLGL